MEKVAIVGAGLIGRAWAMTFARAGWSVAMWDPVDGAAETSRQKSRAGLESLAEYGLCDDPDGAHARISVASSLEAAVEGTSHVQENGPERLEIKKDTFAALDRAAAPETVLASSTSAIQCSLFTEGLEGRARMLVAHPVNPPHLVPVVELSGAPWTSQETIDRARKTFEGIGQAPITVLKEVDGFILNRLQVALLTEAFRLVEQGYVSPADLDTTVSEGLGLRWSFMGPFQTIELNAPGGVEDYCARYAPFFRRVAAEAGGPEVWDPEKIAAVAKRWGPAPDADAHADKSAWRDARLAALAAHKRSH